MSGILVHEWLARRGGSENVFEVLSDSFPDAERFCLWDDSDGRQNRRRIAGRDADAGDGGCLVLGAVPRGRVRGGR